MRRPPVSTLIAALIPWAWFAVRSASPWMDVVAVILPLIGAGALLLAALTTFIERLRLVGVFAVSLAIVSMVAIVVPRLPLGPAATAGDLTVVAANLTGNNPDAGAAVSQLLDVGPDILVLEEANPHAQRRYDDIEAVLPHREEGPMLGRSQVVVFSHYPMTRLELPEEVDTGRIVAVRVTGPEPFIVVGAHLPRPWFRGRGVQLRPPARQALLESLGDWLATLENPVILAGDLNSTDRGVGYRTLLGRADLIDAMRVTWASTTSTKWWPLLLRIDHVLVRGICPSSARNTALEGSDHRSVVAELAFC